MSSAQFTKTTSACLHCRSKKLKCDTNLLTCANCEKAAIVCVAVDPKSGRHYERRYLGELQEKVASLRQRLREQSMQEAFVEHPNLVVLDRNSRFPDDFSDESVKYSPNTSDGSLFSLGNLVALALATHFLSNSRFHVDTHQEPPPESAPAQKMDLPPLSVTCRLADLYFDLGFHKVSPFMRRKEVYQQIERLYDNRAVGTSRIQRRNDMFQLFMILAVATSLVRQTQPSVSPFAYYSSAIQYADILSEPPCGAQIQNTMLLLVFSHLNDISIGSKWKLARQAMRICIQLGYHKKPVQPLDPVTEQVQRRLFWCCYVQERFSACNLGRPIMISDSEITVQMPEEICLDEIRHLPTSRSGVRSEVSVLVRQAALRKISAKVRSTLYTPNRTTTNQDIATKEALATGLAQALEEWRSLHEEKSTDATSSCLFDTVEYLNINLYRERLFIYTSLAFPSGKKGTQFIPGIKHLRYCFDAAVHIIHEYQTLLDRKIDLPIWTHVQDVLRAGFTLLYCGIYIPLFLSQPGQAESTEPNSEPATIIKGMDDCRTMLQNLSRKWLAVTPHLLAFGRLSDEVKRLSRVPQPQVPPGAGDDVPVTSSYLNSDVVPLNGQLTFWNVPLDVSSWDVMLDGDIDMQAVFGNDFDAFHENNCEGTDNWE
ncbi:Zn(2)-C6 fungal-type domain-containing protein [Fusarium sp. Ph1]|nr:Zn(2)-C6 fungal-type domain-containing protein [Fusarium sp. Ph1]